MNKPHLNKGDKIVITASHYYNEYKKDEVGIIVDFMWDYPNWQYLIKFENGASHWVWDTELESNWGQKLDLSAWNKELSNTERDGQRGYIE